MTKSLDFINYTFNISTHILTKRMTFENTGMSSTYIFQLTSSRRGWRQSISVLPGRADYFNSHPHEEDDLCGRIEKNSVEHFNSHPHEEDDHIQVVLIESIAISTHILTKRMTIWCNSNSQYAGHFNSHPHEEDDGASIFSFIYIRNISTHILTKRMTFIKAMRKRLKNISTHILTKRMTQVDVKCLMNSLFQLTSSRRGWLQDIVYSIKKNIFQLTSSRRGWRQLQQKSL